METKPSNCTWELRTSLLLDGELPHAEEELVRRHMASCRVCSGLAAADSTVAGNPSGGRADRTVFSMTPGVLRPSVRLRIVAALLGSMIIALSFPDFVRGSTLGVTFHDLRHLAIWQTAVGITILAGAVTFRLSRLVVILVGSFLLMTLAAVVYDVVTGHRGPWTDPAHIAEVMAVMVLLAMISPRLRALGRSASCRRNNN